MFINNKTSLLVIIALICSLTTGCLSKVGGVHPNSHFAYPNSNIEALGPVEASASRFSLIMGTVVDKKFVQEVYNKALQKSGGDLIINYKFDTEVLMVFPVFITTLKLKGTAAKMTVGVQQLK